MIYGYNLREHCSSDFTETSRSGIYRNEFEGFEYFIWTRIQMRLNISENCLKLTTLISKNSVTSLIVNQTLISFFASIICMITNSQPFIFAIYKVNQYTTNHNIYVESTIFAN